MRAALNELPMDGTVVIGEGERDEAPMLYHRREGRLRAGQRPEDRHRARPARRHDHHRQGRPNALAVLAIAEQGCLLNAPDVYMDKLAIGPGYPEGMIDLTKSPTDNIRARRRGQGRRAAEIIACVLDRPRHAELIAELRALGCGIKLIPDGDVAGVIATTDPDTDVDIYMGTGGAPEGVLAAAALRCVGGPDPGPAAVPQRRRDAAARARWGIEDLDRIYTIEDMAKGDCIFAATGVTDGSLLDGRQAPQGDCLTTESVVMRASSGTVRWVTRPNITGSNDRGSPRWPRRYSRRHGRSHCDVEPRRSSASRGAGAALGGEPRRWRPTSSSTSCCSPAASSATTWRATARRPSAISCPTRPSSATWTGRRTARRRGRGGRTDHDLRRL